MNTALNNVRELLGGETFPECDSMSLRLEKFVRIGDNTKKDEIQSVASKTQEKIRTFAPKGAVKFTAKLGGRLIVNQAGGILENAGLCIHPHYNSPYIPGSAVKGCTRHAAWQAWNELEDGEEKVATAKEIAEIFGYPTGDSKPKKKEDIEPGRVYLDEYLKEKCGYKEDDSRSGKVAFLAAVPETTAKLVVDLVNCHHRDYYAGNKPYAVDDESPVPNFFPAVEAGTRFVFTLFPLSGEDLADQALHWLKVGLSQHGIGAKTAAGYGWFDIDMTDYSSVEPNAELLAKWEVEYSSATSQKKFLKKPEIMEGQDAEILCTVVKFIVTKDWWKKEKTNAGSKITQFVKKWNDKFQLGEV